MWCMQSRVASIMNPPPPLAPGAGCYQYTGDLLKFNRAPPPEVPVVPKELTRIWSPLRDRLPEWRAQLRDHPDQAFVGYILSGLQGGFRVGFDHTSPLAPAKKNMPSAAEHPEVLEEYIRGEVRQGRMIGPLAGELRDGCHMNRMGVIPKGHTPGKWRLITDLSFPEHRSVNDGIDSHLCSLQYTSVEKVATAAMGLGRGALLAKLDVKSAYRLIPVHPLDRPLLGIEWQGSVYVDGMLPFGLRSAPKIFTAVADALEWILRRQGVVHVDHYLDDFIIYGPPGSDQCAEQLQLTLALCERLGVPLAGEKLEGPTECLTFLGIEIDTSAGVLRLPEEKLARVKSALQEWEERRRCTKRELQSLIGTLQHASRVVRPGRSFLRRMIDLAKIPKRPHHFVRLNMEFRADLRWWHVFADHWNGVAVIPAMAVPEIEVTSDASGHWGCGAWSQASWFQYEWPEGSSHHHISFKELFALLLAAAAWGTRWNGKCVRWRCDNQAAVRVIASRSCRDTSMMHLLRCLFFLEAHYQFHIVAVHVPGKDNVWADDLSRDRHLSFLSKAPHMERLASPFPPQLPPLLLVDGNWMSPRWTRRFSSIFGGAWQPLPSGPIERV